MKVLNKIIILAICSVFIQSCVTSEREKQKSTELKDEKPFLAALNHIENNRIEEAKKIFNPNWIDEFAPLIQSTLPGSLNEGRWGFSRARDNKLYLFIYNWQPGHLMQFPNAELPIDSSKCINTGKAVKVKWAIGVEIYMDKAERDSTATVIELSLKGNAENLHQVEVSDWTNPTLNASHEVINNWQNERFGMFIHWGPSSITGQEISWTRKGSKLGRIRYGGAGVNGEFKVDDEYDALYKKFNPVKFDANTWVKIAKDAGMRYIVLVTKHHDSFCLFDSKVTDYDIMSTPYAKDICKQLADACHKQGLMFGWYYSPRDWYNKDFGGDNHQKYMDFYMKQLEELLTNYGKIDILWFDCLDSPQYLWGNLPEESFKKIRQWQPEIIINNRGGLRGDFDTPEQHVGSFERGHPWETCATISTGWSWRNDSITKPLDWCLKTLINTVSRDGNFLLNVSPQPSGLIASEQVERLQEIGQWLSKYGASVYGTRGGPFKPQGGVSSTCKTDNIYLHFTGEERKIFLPEFGYKIINSKLLNGGEVTCENVPKGWEISIQKVTENDVDLIVELKIDGNTIDIKPLDFLNE